METKTINLKKISQLKYLSLIILCIILFSCRSNDFKLYYYNGLNSNYNYIMESAIRIFFEDDREMA